MPEARAVSAKLKALLAIAARVQRGGREVREADVARARAEGATDVEIHDTVLIAAAFCMFNRYVDGLGALTPTDPAGYRERATVVADHGYLAARSRASTTMTSPPAFAWDDWYAAVGGRSIRIPEVNDLLQEIYDHQYPRFDGEVAADRRAFASPADAAQHLKDKALEFGADIVGICEIEPSDVYRGRIVTEKYAIAVGQRMRWREFQVVPSRESAIECLRVYFTLGETVIQLAAYIRSLGYACTVEHPIGDSDLLHIPIGLKAGFGELGRHGSIIHPTLGPLFRMGSVTTSHRR